MSQARRSYRWMEDLLDLLYERYERAEALNLLRDEGERDRAIGLLSDELQVRGMPAGMLQSQEGRGLLMAVLSLRVRLSADEARERVLWNIRVREGRT